MARWLLVASLAVAFVGASWKFNEKWADWLPLGRFGDAIPIERYLDLVYLIASCGLQIVVATLVLMQWRDGRRSQALRALESAQLLRDMEGLRRASADQTATIAGLAVRLDGAVAALSAKPAPDSTVGADRGAALRKPDSAKSSKDERDLPGRIAEEYQQMMADSEAGEALLARWRPQIVEVKNAQHRMQSPGDAVQLAIVDSAESETYYWLIYPRGGSGFLVPSPSMHRARVRYLTPDGILMGALFDDVFSRVEGDSFALQMPARVAVHGDSVRIEALGRISIPSS